MERVVSLNMEVRFAGTSFPKDCQLDLQVNSDR